MPNDSEITLSQKTPPARTARIFVGEFVLVSGFPPFINAMGNPRVATLHGSDLMGLVASGWCCGFGLALLLSRLIFHGD
jgi:hypothetical protein